VCGVCADDFAQAQHFLQHLDTELDADAVSTLEANGVTDLQQLGHKIAEVVTKSISLRLDYSMSQRVINAMKDDLLDCIKERSSEDARLVRFDSPLVPSAAPDAVPEEPADDAQ
jgi:hypothetical protein